MDKISKDVLKCDTNETIKHLNEWHLKYQYDELSFKEVIQQELKIMDMTAFTLCKENNIPIIVLDINDEKSLYNLIKFNNVGTLVS